MINKQLKFEVKIPTVQKLLHSQGQFDLESQGQGRQLSNPSETFRCLVNSSSEKVKFEVVQCLTVK